jgi:hypothetical protein
MDEGTARDYIKDLKEENDTLLNTVHALLAIAEAASQLSYVIDGTVPAATYGGLYGVACDNLRAALRAYYQPTGR